MSNKTEVNTGGIGFGGLLTVLFVGLKLTGYIAWSWWWVLSPLWLPAALIIGFLLLVVILKAIIG